jgi:hypothetical protein
MSEMAAIRSRSAILVVAAAPVRGLKKIFKSFGSPLGIHYYTITPTIFMCTCIYIYNPIMCLYEYILSY